LKSHDEKKKQQVTKIQEKMAKFQPDASKILLLKDQQEKANLEKVVVLKKKYESSHKVKVSNK